MVGLGGGQRGEGRHQKCQDEQSCPEALGDGGRQRKEVEAPLATMRYSQHVSAHSLCICGPEALGYEPAGDPGVW